MDRKEMARRLIFSDHARTRSAQRNLSDEEIRYVVEHGKRFHRRGARIYYLRRRDVPEADRADQEIARLEGTAVILNAAGRVVVTAWRDRQDGLKQIKRMPDYCIDTPAPA